ncbi:MAG: ribonuclease P protein component [Ruminococcus sp.]|nr:ribonuclease P protein component [Ruminococcus sp.]
MLFTETAKDNKIFMRCFRSGGFVSCGFVTAYFARNKLSFNRFGISVGKKQGGAVQRNRIKRIFRAAYRLTEAELPIGYDIIFAARNDACEKTSNDVMSFIRKRLIPKMLSNDSKTLPAWQNNKKK